MSVFEKSRFEIWSAAQHPFKHNLSDFSFGSPALPGVSNVEGALNYILAVLYPNVKPAVDTPGDLPTAGNTITDYRVVLDDGDGKQAAYRWEQREGDVAPQWYKVADMDFSNDSILAQMMDITQDVFVYQQGKSDTDVNGDPIVGVYAGQTIFGGDVANQNLTLNANSGDGTGAQSGFVQIDSQFRPVVHNTYDLSTSAERWRSLYLSNTAFINTMTLSTGSIVDSTGQISFGSNNLITTGNFTSATVTGTQLLANDGTNTLTLVPGSISDSTGQISLGAADLLTTGTLGAGVSTFTSGGQSITVNPVTGFITSSLGLINFDDENISTTGEISAGSLTLGLLSIDNIVLDGNTISTIDANGDLILLPDGTGGVDIQKPLTALGANFTGSVGVVGRLDVDLLRMDGASISTINAGSNLSLGANGTGRIVLTHAIGPSGDATLDIGNSSNRMREVFLSGGLNDGTNAIGMADILSLRSIRFRDLAQTQPAQTGDSAFYDMANDVWLASAPDSEVTHGTISGLTTGDAGHTQFAMLQGRAGGQTIHGDTQPSGSLRLGSTSSGTKGQVQVEDDFTPATTAAFSTTWSGVDLGSPLLHFNNIYSKGEHFGLRPENILSTSLPIFNGQTAGQLYYATDDQNVYVNTGSEVRPLGVSRYVSDLSFTGSITSLDVNVSARITDARNAIWQLLDNSNNFETMNVSIKKMSASIVRITTNTPLPAGLYRLIGL